MDYKSAFNQIVNTQGILVTDDNFLFRSILLDSIGGSFIDKELADAFYQLNEMHIYQNIKNLSLVDSKNYIKLCVSKIPRKYKLSQYIQSVEPILLFLFPNEYQEIDVKSFNKVKKMNKVSKTSKVVINRLPTPTKPTPRRKDGFIDLILDIKCHRLNIKSCQGKKIQICNSIGVVVTNQFPVSVNNGVLNLDINRPYENFVISVPSKKYKEMSIYYEGEELKISPSGKDKICTKKLSFSIAKGHSFIDINATHIDGIQSKGNCLINGNIKSMSVVVSDGNAHCYIDKCSYNTYSIKANKGNVKLKFRDGPIIPRINHLFHPIQYVHRTCKINNKKAQLMLSAPYGKVIVS